MTGPCCTHSELLPAWADSALAPVTLPKEGVGVLAPGLLRHLSSGKRLGSLSRKARCHVENTGGVVRHFKLPLQTPCRDSSIPLYGSGFMPWPAHIPCGRKGMSPWLTPFICPNQVIGVKDSRMGEEICACIRAKTGQDCTEEEIKAFCKGKVGPTVFGSPGTPCWALADPWI